MIEFWQIKYGDGCIGTVIKRLIGYEWEIYIPDVETPVRVGRRLSFSGAILACNAEHDRLEEGRICEWEKQI